jgi:hypothetical protein
MLFPKGLKEYKLQKYKMMIIQLLNFVLNFNILSFGDHSIDVKIALIIA